MGMALVRFLPFWRQQRTPDSARTESRANLDILRKISVALSRPIRALVIEDQAEMSDMITMMLKRICDIDVVQVYDGKEALQRLPERFDIIWMDLRIPSLSGIALAQAIRRYHVTTPVIVCTGFAYEQIVIDQLQELGMYIMLTKPVSIEEIRIVLRLIRVHSMPCNDCPLLEDWNRKDAHDNERARSSD